MVRRGRKTENKGKVNQGKKRGTADSKSLVVPENLELLFMYQELLGKGLVEWEKKMKS